MHEYDIVGWDEVLKAKRIDIILSKEQMKDILEKIGHSTDDDGFIINENTGERELSIDSSEIRPENIGAILPGSVSKIFIKKNIAGFSQYLYEYLKH
jgi:hypothetical protein